VLLLCDGSYAESNWNEGDPIHFNLKGQGMFSVIETKSKMNLWLLNMWAIYKDFKEVPNNNPKQKLWSGAMENVSVNRRRWLYNFGNQSRCRRKIHRLFQNCFSERD